MRREILQPEVHDRYTFASKFAAYQAREYPPKLCPFTHAAWTHPRTTQAISEAAGIPLQIIMDLEVGHVNFQIGEGGPAALRELSPTPSAPYPPSEQKYESTKESVSLHRDAYPFVCVLMLSDCTTMQGGETALQTGDGGIVKVRGPNAGSATVLQGLHVAHSALQAMNAPERITMVTSYRAQDPMVNDLSWLENIKHMSVPNRLNYQWTHYRMELMSQRFAKMAKMLKDKKDLTPDDDEAKVVDVKAMRKWLGDQMKYIEATADELWDEPESLNRIGGGMVRAKL